MRLVKIFSVLLFLLLIYCRSGEAQVGIRVLYNDSYTRSFDDLLAPSSEALSGDNLFNKGYTINLDYWMRLPNYRVEFYPYISYSRLSGTVLALVSGVDTHYSSTSIGLGINTHVYPFDLLGDCDCPTFSKQSGFFKKGFFLLGGAGMNLTKNSFDDRRETNISRFNPNVRAGIGLDIGLSDILTFTPILQYQYSPLYRWPELFEALNSTPEDIPLGQLQFGIRVGLRLDYKK